MYIIFSLLILFFVGTIVAWKLFFSKVMLPKGNAYHKNFGKFEAIVIFDQSIPIVENAGNKKVYEEDNFAISGQEMSDICARCIVATQKAFDFFDYKTDGVGKIVFKFESNKSFATNKKGKAWREWSENIGAYLGYTSSAFFRPKLPVAFIKSDLMKMTSENGRPAIHECIHLFLKKNYKDYDSHHKKEEVWIADQGQNSYSTEGESNIEQKAMDFFKKIDF